MTVRFHVYVSGRVQGVWFRESARSQALGLGVSGWVRNLPDGRVEAVFEGPPGPVEAMLAWAEHGPLHARVEQLIKQAEPPRGELGFTVL
jgi:acylphosphatase